MKYHVVVNGEEVGPISPVRGLRQGDPISPHLFFLCAEGLSRLIKKAEHDNLIHRIRVSRRAPTVSHLLFTDDSFLFFKASVSECVSLKDVLKRYELGSGQAINLAKLGIFFSSNVGLECKNAIKEDMMISANLDTGRYLGLLH